MKVRSPEISVPVSGARAVASIPDRMDILSRLPCMCCVVEGIRQPWRTEVHHIVDKGYRKHSGGDDSTLPLCSWHHRGLVPDGMTGSEASFKYGPSLATNKRAFVDCYGSERKLLTRINGLLNDADRA